MRSQELAAPCPVCGGADRAYMWSHRGRRLDRCTGCALVIRSGDAGHEPGPSVWTESDWRTVTSLLQNRRAAGPILIVADRADIPAGANTPLATTGATIASAAEEPTVPQQQYATILVISGLSTATDPKQFLETLRLRLATGGVLLIAEALADSRAARLLRRRWQGWILPARWHFSRKTLHLLLLRAGFHRVWVRDLSRARHLQSPLGRVLASAEASDAPPATTVSIIVPVFNEAATCATLLDRVLAKALPGMTKEVVIVESNSTDGTREIVRQYQHAPGVRVVFEDRPRGKGHAVRSGLAHATGSIILIQDGDLEYDIDDYEALLAPLVDWTALFVLGSRHTGHFKMRVFNDAPLTAAVFNAGQIFYTGLVNIVLGTRMADPFTMYKVFRRDCLHGLEFTGRRFDFDFELVMKLVRKGYIPLELPVNYQARSFADGKKVSFVRDGLTWVWVVAKYGVGRLGPGDTPRFESLERS